MKDNVHCSICNEPFSPNVLPPVGGHAGDVSLGGTPGDKKEDGKNSALLAHYKSGGLMLYSLEFL